MRSVTVLIALVSYFHALRSEEVRLLDLEPNDAQQIIEKQDQTLKYAPKIDTNVPAVRYLGKEPHNVLEDIYLARQYHGQDGLGGYLYGYSVPDIAKNEKKQAGGDLRGAYNYVNGAGQEIKVEYWDDGTGFHQVDNVPKILPKQIDDSPEVKAAKDQFLKRWQEEAERNQHPVQSPYNSEGQYASGPLSAQGQLERQQSFAKQSPGNQQYYSQAQPQFSASSSSQQTVPYSQPQAQHQFSASSSSQQTASYPQPQPQYQQAASAYQQSANQPQPPVAYGPAQQSPSSKYLPGQQPEQNQIDYTGQFTENKNVYAKNNAQEEEGVTGPPKGFFYSFDYPVGIIVQKGDTVKREGGLKGVYEENKHKFEAQLAKRSSDSGSSAAGYVYIQK